MTAQLIPALVYRDFTNNGLPLAFGTVTSYAAGTTTPQATYTDYTQTTQNTNPVILNARGEANIWLDPTLSYKFVVQDSIGNTIRTVDNLAGPLSLNQNILPAITNTYTLGSPTFTWADGYFGTNVYIEGVPAYQTLGAIIGSTGTTAAETAASVTPYNFGYPPGLVDRYVNGGNIAPGTTDTTSAWNAAVAQAIQVGGAEVTYFTSSLYLVTAPINCTFTGSANQPGLKIRGLGGPSNDAGHGILARHTGVAIFDFTGSDGATVENIITRTDSSVFPQTGLLFAKNSAGSGTACRPTNCDITGYFSIAPHYNYGADDAVYVGNRFVNIASVAGAKASVFTANNISALVSPYTTIASGAKNMSDITYYGNFHQMIGSSTTSDALYLEEQAGFKMYGGYIFNAGLSTNSRAGIYFDGTNGATSGCVFDGVFIDVGSNDQGYGLLFSNSSVTHSTITVSNCKLGNATYAIAAAGTNPDISQLHMVNNFEGGSSHGLSWPGTIENSIIDEPTLVLAIGVSQQNTLTGSSANWSITTRSNDNWRDSGATNKSFAPGVANGVAGWTTVGAITQVGRLLYTGNIAEFTIAIQGATSVAWTNVATITLPFTAVQIGVASITDYTAGTTVGPATFSGSTLKLVTAQTTSGDQFIITGRAFIA